MARFLFRKIRAKQDETKINSPKDRFYKNKSLHRNLPHDKYRCPTFTENKKVDNYMYIKKKKY